MVGAWVFFSYVISFLKLVATIGYIEMDPSISTRFVVMKKYERNHPVLVVAAAVATKHIYIYIHIYMPCVNTVSHAEFFFRIMKKCIKCMCDIHLLFLLFEFHSLIFTSLTKTDKRNVKQHRTPLWRDLCQSVNRKLPILWSIFYTYSQLICLSSTDYDFKYLIW